MPKIRLSDDKISSKNSSSITKIFTAKGSTNGGGGGGGGYIPV